MDKIKKAIERAKAETPAPRYRLPVGSPQPPQPVNSSTNLERWVQLAADPYALERHRIFVNQGNNALRFDQLRTRILGDMRDRGWKTLMITSPTIGCGKTVTAINVAMSMARQPEGFTILADLDLRKPQLATYLGVQREFDTFDLLKGRAGLGEVLFSLDVSGSRLVFLPTQMPAAQPAEVLSSMAMSELVASLKKVDKNGIVIFDMPPTLVADDVLAFMPRVDAVMLVVAAGQSRTHEVEEALQTIPESKLLGIVLSKSADKISQYYY